MRTLSLVVLAALVLVGGVRGYDTPSCDGRQTIVQLFEWKWTDVAEECERFLADAGFCAVQVSPATEHVVLEESGYPWWQRYQPVSYLLESRSGSTLQFINMVQRCNAVGVRIIVDVVVNHMAKEGTSGYGSACSYFSADDLQYPAVPYSSEDFTPRALCPSVDGGVHNYSDETEVRNCYLAGLNDLYTASDAVRDQLSSYLTLLLDIGVMGFRIDSSKYVWPEDLEAIQSLTNNLNIAEGFPSGHRPFFYHEVLDLGTEPISVNDYFGIGLTTEFRFSSRVAAGVDNFTLLAEVYDSQVGMAPSYKALVFVDNHDTQRGFLIGVEGLTYKQAREYKMGVTFSLAYDYGFMRIMSSYDFDDNDQGPPDSDNNGSTDSVPISADGSCGGGWVCEHRWNAIVQMVMFRNVVSGTQVDNWYQENEDVAFSRGHLGFFAMSKLGSLDKVLQTGLPAGVYCELISNCTRSVTVAEDGTARIAIFDYQEPILAFCVGCGTPVITTKAPTTTTPTTTTPTTTTSTTTTPTTTTPTTTTPTTTTPTTTTSTTTTPTTTTPTTTTPTTTTSTTTTPTTTTPTTTTSTTTTPTTTTPTTTTPTTTTTTIEASTTPAFGGKVKTVIFIYRRTDPGQDLFIIGGIDINHRPGCKPDAESDPCSLDITVNSLGTNEHYDKYNAWREGDTKLDWYGAQEGQGNYHGVEASGTPLVWTTSHSGAPEYQELNTFGDHYWMVDVIMDCAQTDEGWFHFRSFLTNTDAGVEPDINQVSYCSGEAGGSKPYDTMYHTARCGYINVFAFGDPACHVDPLP